MAKEAKEEQIKCVRERGERRITREGIDKCVQRVREYAWNGSGMG